MARKAGKGGGKGGNERKERMRQGGRRRGEQRSSVIYRQVNYVSVPAVTEFQGRGVGVP